MNRPGFQKQFQALADKAWENAIQLIQHMSKRGVAHSFSTYNDFANTNIMDSPTLELYEVNALALALDVEKKLAIEAHTLHKQYMDRSEYKNKAQHTVSNYDPEVCVVEWRDCMSGKYLFSISFLNLDCPLFGREIHRRTGRHYSQTLRLYK